MNDLMFVGIQVFLTRQKNHQLQLPVSLTPPRFRSSACRTQLCSYKRWTQLAVSLVIMFLFLNKIWADSFCEETDPTRKLMKLWVNSKTPMRNGYISANLATARLANGLFEMCTLYGISEYLNRRPVIYLKNYEYIRTLRIMNVTMPGLMEKFDYRLVEDLSNAQQVQFMKKCCTYINPYGLKTFKSKQIHLKGNVYQSYKHFDAYREQIRSFVSSEGKFEGLPVSNSSSFITCIHVRRTDFLHDRHFSKKDFIVAAREFIKIKENQQNMKTVIMGDDIEFESDIFRNETNVFVSTQSPPKDIMYSRYNCDATLISAPSSTFGWWISYLSKGERVYYLDITTTRDIVYIQGEMVPNDFYDTRWTALKFDNIRQKVSLSL